MWHYFVSTINLVAEFPVLWDKKNSVCDWELEATQVRIQDFVKGGAPASEAESCRRSEAESCERSEHSAAGVQGPLKGPGSFWVFFFGAQICILTHSRDSFSLIFDIYFDAKSW